jgi:hypothetical protein
MEREIERIQAGAFEELMIEKGSAYVYYAFDVGSSIELDKAELLLAAEKKKAPSQEKKRQSKYFEFTPPPIRWREETASYTVGPRFESLPCAEMLLFDFGCVSVCFEIPLAGPISEIIALSVDLYDNFRLQEAAQNLVTKLIGKINSVIDKPELASRFEDYCIFHFSKIDPRLSIKSLLERHITPMACILRAETSVPSDREAQEILTDRISYGSNDVTLMSWYGAVIYGENAEDIYAVLEFANLLLLELSFLDGNLDRSLDSYYDFFTEHRRSRYLFGARSKRPLMRSISQLQIESAILFERITNALKLMGDDFQAKVFRLATKKMGLSSWDASISRKLQTIESIYQKISDAEGARRMEVLEIIVILLILVEIFLSSHVR